MKSDSGFLMPSVCSWALLDFNIFWFRTAKCIHLGEKCTITYSCAASLWVCLPSKDNLCFMLAGQEKKKSNLKHWNLILELFLTSWTFLWKILITVFVLSISHLPCWLHGKGSLLNIYYSWIFKFWSNVLYFTVIWLMCFKCSFSWSFSMQRCQSRHSILDWCFLEYWWW